MAPTQSKALYYPLIDIPDEGWLLSSLLLWDQIDRIVPKAVSPNDSAMVTEIGKAGLLKNSAPDDIDQYRADNRLQQWVSDKREVCGSLRSILQASPKALSNFVKETSTGKRVAVHMDKMTLNTVKTLTGFLAEIQEEASKKRIPTPNTPTVVPPERAITRREDDDGEWVEMPAWAGNLYMCGLAMSMAHGRKLEPITNGSPFMGWARFLGDKPMSTEGLLLELEVPWPSSEKMFELACEPKSKGASGLDRIFKFREKYAAERAAMRTALLAVQGDVRTVDNTDALNDCLGEHRKHVEKSSAAYRQAMRDSLTEVCTAGIVISLPLLAFTAPAVAMPPAIAAVSVAAGYGIVKAADSFRNQRKATKEKHPWHYASLVEKHLA